MQDPRILENSTNSEKMPLNGAQGFFKKLLYQRLFFLFKDLIQRFLAYSVTDVHVKSNCVPSILLPQVPPGPEFPQFQVNPSRTQMTITSTWALQPITTYISVSRSKPNFTSSHEPHNACMYSSFIWSVAAHTVSIHLTVAAHYYIKTITHIHDGSIGQPKKKKLKLLFRFSSFERERESKEREWLTFTSWKYGSCWLDWKTITTTQLSWSQKRARERITPSIINASYGLSWKTNFFSRLLNKKATQAHKKSLTHAVTYDSCFEINCVCVVFFEISKFICEGVLREREREEEKNENMLLERIFCCCCYCHTWSRKNDSLLLCKIVLV